MTGAFGASLHFAAHLLGLTVALGAAIVVAGDRDETRAARLAGVAGFLSLVAGEALHGGAFSLDLAVAPVTLRTVGFALLGIFALAPVSRAGAAAIVAFPARAFPPALVALLAAAAFAWRRRDPRHRVLGAALALFGAAEAIFAARADLTWAFAGYHWVRMAGFLLIAWFVLVVGSRSIQIRIVAGFVSLLLIVVLGVSSAVTLIVDRNLRTGAVDRVDAQARELERRFEPLIGDKTNALIALASTEEVSGRIARRQRFRTEEMERLRELSLADVDFILFLGPEGQVLGRAGLGSGKALEVVGTDVVDTAIGTGIDAASVDQLGTAELALVGVVPIGDRRVIGFAVAGNRLNSVFLDALEPPGSRAALFRGGADPRLVAQVGFPEGVTSVVGPERLQEIWPRIQSGEVIEQRELSLPGGRHFVSFEPLTRPDGDVVGMLLVAEPAEILAATQRDVNRVIFLVTLGVVGLAFLSSLLAARRISRPVRALTRAARRVQAGDLEAKAPVTGSDEVGDLGIAFNRMTESIAEMTGDLRDAAQEQSRLRGRLETVLNSMTEGLVAVDTDDLVVTYNDAAGDITGRSVGAAVGSRLRDIVKVLDAERAPLRYQGKIPSRAAFVRRRDGTDVPVAISSGPLRAGREVLGHVYVLRDMTREHEVERMKTEFLSNVSHELRTPLTPIIGYSEILQRRKVPAARATDFASGILQSARRLERIVAMLVDFSAMEGGRMSIATQPTPIRPLVTDAVSEWRRRNDRHRFVTKMPKSLPQAEADVQLVRRTLEELLDNAVKYSPDGGKITVSVAEQNSGRRRILEFEVADQGIGIEPGELGGIFQDFRQVDASDTRTFGGLGLGLAFVKRIVEAHGGTIGAESTPGAGATFRFTIPVADGKKKATKKKAKA